MKITVYYMAQLKQAAGVASEVIEWNKAGTTAELVRHLAEKHGDRLNRLLLDGQGKLQPTILMFVNDVQVTSEKEIILQDGDEVSFLSPIAGGEVPFFSPLPLGERGEGKTLPQGERGEGKTLPRGRDFPDRLSEKIITLSVSHHETTQNQKLPSAFQGIKPGYCLDFFDWNPGFDCVDGLFDLAR